MKMIVGLGNPGEKYAKTRHNLGFMALEALLKKLTPAGTSWEKVPDVKVEIAKVGQLILIKPQTFMNNCGWPIAKLFNNLTMKQFSNLWVIHDDLDLPLGKIKIRTGGGTAGHHGLESIVKHLGATDFVRFRLGIGKPRGHDKWQKVNVKRKEIEDYVLSEFLPQERDEARIMVQKIIEAIIFARQFGLEKAMNKFNAK